MSPQRPKLIWTVLGLLAVAASIWGRVDATGERYAADAFSQALVTFAMARTLNGVISVAQGTEVAVEPAGVGVNFTVGQILDPINDLIERFSSIMLLATSSIGLQRILLTMSAWWAATALLSIFVLIGLVALWLPRRRWLSESTGVRLIAIAIVIRFAVPVFVICTQFITDEFLADQRSEAVAALDATRVEVETFNEEATAASEEDQSLLQQLGSALSNSLEAINFGQRIDDLSERVSNASEHVINLIVIFVLQSVILPLVFLWGFAGLLKSLAARTTKL